MKQKPLTVFRTAIASAAFLLVTACTPDTPQQATASADESADLLIHNANVLVLDAADTRATAVAVSAGEIIAVGGDELTRRFTAAETIDLRGQTLMPGFIDSHTHISGNPPHYIDLNGVESVARIRELVSAKAETLGPGHWITGYGWSEDELSEQRRPLIGDLDAAAPDNPVILTRAGGHSAVCSSSALELAGIDATTPDPDGGVIERDDQGNLNGIIRERQELVGALVPESTDEVLRPSLVANLQALLRKGITSIVQASDSIEHYAEWERVYAQNRGELPRAAVQVAYEGRGVMQAFGPCQWLRR